MRRFKTHHTLATARMPSVVLWISTYFLGHWPGRAVRRLFGLALGDPLCPPSRTSLCTGQKREKEGELNPLLAAQY